MGFIGLSTLFFNIWFGAIFKRESAACMTRRLSTSSSSMRISARAKSLVRLPPLPIATTAITTATTTMLDHLLPRVFDDVVDNADKENIGYFVRRPTASLRTEFDGTPMLHRRRSSSPYARRTPSPAAIDRTHRHLLRSRAAAARASTITPQDAKKKVMTARKTATRTSDRLQSPKRATRSNRAKRTETSKKIASRRSQSVGIVRRPLQDITHLYVNERPTLAASRCERKARDALATSVSIRFY